MTNMSIQSWGRAITITRAHLLEIAKMQQGQIVFQSPVLARQIVRDIVEVLREEKVIKA